MYLVGRNRVVNPASPWAAVAVAIEAGQRASQIIDRPVYTWARILGPDPLTVMWSARVDHLADVVVADDALAADDEFNDWTEQHNDLFVSPLVGVVSQVVHGAPTGEPKAFITVTSAVAANGALGEAMAIGVELAETLTTLTGQEAMFLAPVTGDVRRRRMDRRRQRPRRGRGRQRHAGGVRRVAQARRPRRAQLRARRLDDDAAPPRVAATTTPSPSSRHAEPSDGDGWTARRGALVNCSGTAGEWPWPPDSWVRHSGDDLEDRLRQRHGSARVRRRRHHLLREPGRRGDVRRDHGNGRVSSRERGGRRPRSP